jgi:hypothetical protein
MADNNDRPNNIEDTLCSMKSGQWFGFNNLNGNDANKTYANLIILDGSTKPSESALATKLSEIQTAYDAVGNNRTSAINKLKALGLSEAEVKALIGV